jgi:two-component system, chemotaxis family, CheB/CheR fusion protein
MAGEVVANPEQRSMEAMSRRTDRGDPDAQQSVAVGVPSKEELQSINEELQTVNAELNVRIDELSRANSDITNLLESTQIATLFLDRNLALKNFTPAAKDLFRLIESDVGRPITDIRVHFDADTVAKDAERVLRTSSSIERKVESRDNGACYVMRLMPYRTLDDVIAGVVIIFVDITKITTAEARIDDLAVDLRNRSEQKRAEAHQQVLLHELQHRVKNILATISALATRMLRDAPSVDGFSNAFLGRLRAMAATHELLSQANWAGADLRQLLETTLRGQNPSAGAIHIDGPAVLLTPATASTLGMVVYEMATNAAKYGALSSARGRIEIGWTVVRDAAGDRLGLCWTELAGPPVPAAIADGFGVAFIKGGVEYELQGSAVVEPRPAGLRWELEFPLKGNVKDV